MSQGSVPSGELSPQVGNAAPAPRSSSAEPPVARQPGKPRPTTHQGSGLPLADRPTREESWAALSVKMRDRLAELAGEVIEWFARHDPSYGEHRPRAVVLGTKALCIAEPRIDTTGRPVYELNRYEFVPGSHKTRRVEHRPRRNVSGEPRPSAQPGASLPRRENDLGLSLRESGQLGNLPPAAQELLQAPFSSTDPVRRCEYFYEGFPNRLDVYMFLLAGRHFVTAAVGTQQVPVGHTVANAHWDLICHRLAVERIVGS
jgi:hypothetical protein